MQSIVQHAVRSKCPFTEDQIASLKKESKKISEAKHKIKMAEKYRTDRIEHPEKYEKKNQDRKRNYDTDKRTRDYQKHKKKIALKYQTDKIEHPEVYEQKKQERMKSYDSSKRKTRYQAEKFDLALKYQKKKIERTNKKGKIVKVKNIEIDLCNQCF